MYSKVFEPKHIEFYDLYGVTDENTEIKLWAYKYFYPFNERSLEEVFHWRRSFRERRLILKTLKSWYDTRSIKKNWPSLKSLRLYKSQWNWSTVRNQELSVNWANLLRTSPDKRELLLEWPNGS